MFIDIKVEVLKFGKNQIIPGNKNEDKVGIISKF